MENTSGSEMNWNYFLCLLHCKQDIQAPFLPALSWKLCIPFYLSKKANTSLGADNLIGIKIFSTRQNQALCLYRGMLQQFLLWFPNYSWFPIKTTIQIYAAEVKYRLL